MPFFFRFCSFFFVRIYGVRTVHWKLALKDFASVLLQVTELPHVPDDLGRLPLADGSAEHTSQEDGSELWYLGSADWEHSKARRSHVGVRAERKRESQGVIVD